MSRFTMLLIFAAAMCTFAQTTAPAAGAAPEKKLIAYWAFDEGQGEICKNSANEKLPGKIEHNMRGVTWVEGKQGKALHFLGSKDKKAKDIFGSVSCPGFPCQAFGNGLSIECWVKMDKDANWQSQVFYLIICSPGNYGPGFVLQYNWRNYQMVVGPGGKEGSTLCKKYTPLAPVPDLRGQWVHVCVTTSPKDKTQIYINGELKATAKEPGFFPVNQQRSTLVIGSGWGGRVNGFPGAIDEVKIYNYVLPATEIVQHAKLNL